MCHRAKERFERSASFVCVVYIYVQLCAIDVKPNYPFHCRSFANATFDEFAWDVREKGQLDKCQREASSSF